ncbi:MAG: DUF488 domain-containing protein [Actinobacteria bacterium]|nr:DUF488 domain-containing protein [Actinomycetota bacterium]
MIRAVPLLTVGHGTLAIEQFTQVLVDAGVERLVDVRRLPGSRRNPQFAKDALLGSLPMEYVWEPRLGGRREASGDSRHSALRERSFQAYADHMVTDEFAHALADVLDDRSTIALMCAESVWWRCHRRLIADHLVLVEQVPVDHLFHDGRRQAHVPTPAARVEGGIIIYDVGETAPLTGA